MTTSNTTPSDPLPWTLTLHYTEWPASLVPMDPALKTQHDAFINAVKEADFLRTSAIAMGAQIRSGRPGPLVPPSDEIVAGLDPRVIEVTDQMQAVRAVGTPDDVATGLQAFVDAYDLDEVITTTYTWDPALRRRSYALLADAWGLTG